jgi:O-antigen/teichoic acid export membrane protein
VLRIPQELRSESLSAFYLLAISLPIVIITAGLRGFLEALQRFDLVNKMRIPMGVMIFLGPLMILPFTRNLSYLIGILVVVRTIGFIAHVIICFREMPSLLNHIKFARSNISYLFRFGTWMTISNILGPLMTYLDRFLIGALLSVAFVAYYATPYEVVTKLLIIPSSLACVLFPAFATSFSGGDEKRIRMLFNQGLKYLFIIMFPIVLTLVLFAKEALTLWLNSDFASQGTHVMQLLAFGIMINSLAQVPFVLLQGIGRPDITAKLHMIEFPLYLILFWILVSNYGIDGAAVAWVVRVLIDLFLLILRTRVLFPINRLMLMLSAAIFGASAVLAMGSMIDNPFHRGLYLLFILSVFIFLSWKLIMTAEDKKYIAQRILRATS